MLKLAEPMAYVLHFQPSMQVRQDDGKIQAIDQDSKDYVLMIMIEPSTVQLVNLELPTEPQRVQVIRVTANDIMSHPVIMDMHFANDVQGLESALIRFKQCGALATAVSSISSVCDLTTLTRSDVQQQATTPPPSNVDVRRGSESSEKSDVGTLDSAFELHEGVIPLVSSRKVSTDNNRSSKSSVNGNYQLSSAGSFKRSKINSSLSSGSTSHSQYSSTHSRSGSSVQAASRETSQDAAREGESEAVKSNLQERSSLKLGQRYYLQDVLVDHGRSVGEIDPREVSAKCECIPQLEPPTSGHMPSTYTLNPKP
jgi:hypothetical protein